MRWIWVGLLITGCGGTGSPLELGPEVQAVMYYTTTAQVPCEISVMVPRAQYVDAVRPKYAWRVGADEWCQLSEASLDGQPVYASFDCGSLKTQPPYGCSPDACAWTPP